MPRRVVPVDHGTAMEDAVRASRLGPRPVVELAVTVDGCVLVDGISPHAGSLALGPVATGRPRFDDVDAANLGVVGGPDAPGVKHALGHRAHVAGVPHDELHLAAGPDVVDVPEVGRQPFKMAPPLVDVAVLLLQQRRLLPVLLGRPVLVGPAEHKGHVGVAVVEHCHEHTVHDGLVEPVVVEGQSVDPECRPTGVSKRPPTSE